MPRPKLIRHVSNPPKIRGFKPIGTDFSENPVVLNIEEYEAIRLSDYELLSQAQAAIFMGVSRPTFTRIYESARRKVALSFVTGSTLIFEGGKVYFDSDWYKCDSCDCRFTNPEKNLIPAKCPLCGSTEIGKSAEEDEIVNEYLSKS
jgi:uncharacterized protein